MEGCVRGFPSLSGHGTIKMSQSNKRFWQHALTTKLQPGTSSTTTGHMWSTAQLCSGTSAGFNCCLEVEVARGDFVHRCYIKTDLGSEGDT